MALCVLVGGFCAAMLFRRSPPPHPALAPAAQLKAHGKTPAQVVPSSDVHSTLPAEPKPAPPSPEQIAAATPADTKPLSHLTAKPIETDTGSSAWRPPADSTPSYGRPAKTHRIVDGDTLESLAVRYLGSADRANELFEANRDILTNPKLLPIDAELKIPR